METPESLKEAITNLIMQCTDYCLLDLLYKLLIKSR